MARTRSHKTFEDDEKIEVIAKTAPKIEVNVIDEENSSDSDDAPEEESVSVGKKKVLEKQKAQEKLMKQKRDEAKNKHKEIEEKRKLAKLEKEIKELEKQRKELNNIEDEIPDELPMDLLESVELEKNIPESQKNKKIVFDDAEENKKLEKSNKRKFREERLKKLRELKSKNVKQVEGGINVKLVESSSIFSSSIKNDNQNKKNEWLMRKRIRRE